MLAIRCVCSTEKAPLVGHGHTAVFSISLSSQDLGILEHMSSIFFKLLRLGLESLAAMKNLAPKALHLTTVILG